MKYAVVKPTEHITLRPYQRDTVESALSEIKQTKHSIVLELATGAGKSIIIAEIAKTIHQISGKKILCLAPSKELIEQNHGKYLSYGYEASIFCASAGSKCSKHSVIFGSPISVLNSVGKFSDQFSAVIIDECHRITRAIKRIIGTLKTSNPNLRVVGLTATPYRLGSGYIYEIDEEGKIVEQAKEPYFKKLVYRLGAEYLIEKGYLSRPITEIQDGYDTSDLELAKNGEFTPESVKKVFVGKGRLTSKIVNEVVMLTEHRKSVMFFAATIEHAEEIMASLPPNNSKLITGQTERLDREKIINDFKEMKFKYIVNVAVLTTGFDAPAVDCIAILRRTASDSLLQQIIGRGLRLSDGKKDCLILDYAENIKDGNLFNPEIKAVHSKESKSISCICESCGATNVFKERPNKDGFKIDDNGYYLDLSGERLIDTETGLNYPAHFGRRCTNTWLSNGEYERCVGRWSFKVCKECNTENDIAARKCIKCSFELVDPNKKLHLKIKPDEKMSKVEHIEARVWKSKDSRLSVKVDYYLEDSMISVWYFPYSRSNHQIIEWGALCSKVAGAWNCDINEFVERVNSGQCNIPKEIAYHKNNGYYKINRYVF